MSSFRIQAPPLHVAATEKPTTDESKKAEYAKVGRDFEAILVRQMLTQAKVAGKSGGYADMAVESLATSITVAGGLGMGRAIEDALTRSGAHPRTVESTRTAHGEATARDPLKPWKSSGINVLHATERERGEEK